ncbi:oligosaccharide biosynthesis protein Alg14 like-domain-containing protein [Blastocladiella britannica]|nr:oligosaccharide biosynthesis protein Alg14 like-domain-containing protein [Blastocladiella britannica]
MTSAIAILAAVLLAASAWLVLRTYAGYLAASDPERSIVPGLGPRGRMLVVHGSGGHTFEMMQLLHTLTVDPDACPYTRIFVVARGDAGSLAKLAQLEGSDVDIPSRIHLIPRARRVGQPLWSAPVTTAIAFAHALRIVYAEAPRLVLCNGPGTCLPLCLAAALLRMAGLVPTRILFVESIARVHTLSLTGKLIYHLRLGELLVQWPSLLIRYPRARHHGILV